MSSGPFRSTLQEQLPLAGCGREQVMLKYISLLSPVDLDIFSALSRRWPLVRMERGHLLGSPCQMAVWLYSANVRWLFMRSLPDVCKHTHAQYFHMHGMQCSLTGEVPICQACSTAARLPIMQWSCLSASRV